MSDNENDKHPLEWTPNLHEKDYWKFFVALGISGAIIFGLQFTPFHIGAITAAIIVGLSFKLVLITEKLVLRALEPRSDEADND